MPSTRRHPVRAQSPFHSSDQFSYFHCVHSSISISTEHRISMRPLPFFLLSAFHFFQRLRRPMFHFSCCCLLSTGYLLPQHTLNVSVVLSPFRHPSTLNSSKAGRNCGTEGPPAARQKKSIDPSRMDGYAEPRYWNRCMTHRESTISYDILYIIPTRLYPFLCRKVMCVCASKRIRMVWNIRPHGKWLGRKKKKGNSSQDPSFCCYCGRWIRSLMDENGKKNHAVDRIRIYEYRHHFCLTSRQLLRYKKSGKGWIPLRTTRFLIWPDVFFYFENCRALWEFSYVYSPKQPFLQIAFAIGIG